MTQTAAAAVIACICNLMNTKEAKVLCIETYANCAVYSDGRARENQIKTKKEFMRSCNFYPSQGVCIERYGEDGPQ